jgi:hypothetical protein
MAEPGGQHWLVTGLKDPPPGQLFMKGCCGRQLPLTCGTWPGGQQSPVYVKDPEVSLLGG